MSDFWKGMGLPWSTTIPSVIEPKQDKDVLRSSILFIILTRFGERVMLPEFGSPVPDVVFEPNDELSAADLRRKVKEAIQLWDDRIEFRDFIVQASENTMRCILTYRDNISNLSDSYETVEFEITPSMFTG